MRREDTDWWLAVSFPPSLFRLHDKFASCDTLLHIMSTNWKEEIYNALIRRNKLQTQPFVALIEQGTQTNILMFFVRLSSNI